MVGTLACMLPVSATVPIGVLEICRCIELTVRRCCRWSGALKLEVLRLGGTALAIYGTNAGTLRQLGGLPRLRQVPLLAPRSPQSGPDLGSSAYCGNKLGLCCRSPDQMLTPVALSCKLETGDNDRISTRTSNRWKRDPQQQAMC